MNVTATMTSKGQVTIPQAIREALGLDAGMRLSFELEGSELRVSPLPSTTWHELWHTAKSAPRPQQPVDVEAAIQAAVRQRISR
ncbi:MAG: AbrB/MazE/SpoVT family DNA-binding domain-containing protein [Holophagaceae bacterium]|nr:AbrB/MazE/SpoVT family DNA-binding domain-containing protein [Holophagaceae bacterium]